METKRRVKKGGGEVKKEGRGGREKRVEEWKREIRGGGGEREWKSGSKEGKTRRRRRKTMRE